MYEGELITFLRKWHKAGRYPSMTVWPKTITFGPQFWRSIREIAAKTKAEQVEYALSIFSVENKIHTSKPFRGYSSKVETRHQITVKQTPLKNDRVEREILIDDVSINKESMSRESAVKTKPVYSFLFNVHTHPENKFGADSLFGFFSETDINSFLNTGVMIMGLITDKLWLCCKTAESAKSLGENGREILQGIGQQTLTGRDKELLANFKLAFYNAPFNGLMQRVL